jgi:recombination protein RecA
MTSTIEELAATLNKKLGDDFLVVGSKAKLDIPRVTTGILSYDLATGGGWASNQWNEIVGDESSGKTAICYKAVAANQALDDDFIALWVAGEEYVPSYAKACGVDLDRLWVVETNEMETALETVLKAVENRLVDMVVIDSLPALVTVTEVEKKMDEASVATGAQILSRFFKKSAKAQRRSLVEDDRPCTMIAINQWRDKIGVMYGDPRTTPGGKAKNYYFFVRLETRRDDWLATGSKIEDRVGQVIKCRTIKNKTYRPQQVSVVDFYFAEGNGFHAGEFDDIKDIVNVSMALDIITRRGSMYDYDGQTWKGKETVLQAVREDLGLQASLREAAFNSVLHGKSTVGTEDDAEWLSGEDEYGDDS